MSEDPAAPPLPAIPASAGALIFDGDGRLLILKTSYKKGWTIPGGVMEADGESPWEACQREVREETGLDMRRGQLVCVDFRRPRPGRPGGIRFLFHCGMFGQTELGALVLQEEEIAESRVLPLPEALPLLSKPVRRRVQAASRASGLIYLEDGHPLEAVGAAGGDSA